MTPAVSQHNRHLYLRLAGLAVLAAAIPISCGAPAAKQQDRLPYGYIWYLDGAGGGGLHNYGGGVRKGMREAGYKGGGEIFKWNTGLGVTADQLADDKYKRKKAGELAAKIQEYKRQFPSAPTSLIGLSAGTAITVFTLEALPENVQVDHVVLLGASVSANRNLTQALKRVKHELYIFTSENDAVLRFLVPVSGTADRSGTVSAGLRGFRMPAGATSETRTQYRKVSNVPWRKEFERKGNYGGHTDTVNARFVQAYIAPLLMTGTTTEVKVAKGQGHVANPDFLRWKDFKVGSWVRMDGEQTAGGKRFSLRVTERLAERQKGQIVVERTYEMPETNGHHKREFYIMATIDPDEHPFTHRGVRITDLPRETLRVGSRSLACDVKQVQSSGDYPEWGRNPSGKIHLNNTVPGGLARIRLKASSSEGPFEYSGEVSDFKAIK